MSKLVNDYSMRWPLNPELSSQSLFNKVLGDLREGGFTEVADEIERLSTERVEEEVNTGNQKFLMGHYLTEYEKIEVLTGMFIAMVDSMIEDYGKLRREAGRSSEIEESIVLAQEVVMTCQVWLRTHVIFSGG